MVHHNMTAKHVRLCQGWTGDCWLGGECQVRGASERCGKSKNEAQTDRQKTFHKRLRGAFHDRQRIAGRLRKR
jgi:hypothetical protein